MAEIYLATDRDVHKILLNKSSLSKSLFWEIIDL